MTSISYSIPFAIPSSSYTVRPSSSSTSASVRVIPSTASCVAYLTAPFYPYSQQPQLENPCKKSACLGEVLQRSRVRLLSFVFLYPVFGLESLVLSLASFCNILYKFCSVLRMFCNVLYKFGKVLQHSCPSVVIDEGGLQHSCPELVEGLATFPFHTTKNLRTCPVRRESLMAFG